MLHLPTVTNLHLQLPITSQSANQVVLEWICKREVHETTILTEQEPKKSRKKPKKHKETASLILRKVITEFSMIAI